MSVTKKSEPIGLGWLIGGTLLAIVLWPLALIVVILYVFKWMAAEGKPAEKKESNILDDGGMVLCCFLGILIVGGLVVYHKKGQTGGRHYGGYTVSGNERHAPAYNYKSSSRRRLGACTGSASCDVCSTCSSCAHCRSSGTCSVCSY
jgi:hypothetical protein